MLSEWYFQKFNLEESCTSTVRSGNLADMGSSLRPTCTAVCVTQARRAGIVESVFNVIAQMWIDKLQYKFQIPGLGLFTLESCSITIWSLILRVVVLKVWAGIFSPVCITGAWSQEYTERVASQHGAQQPWLPAALSDFFVQLWVFESLHMQTGFR